MSRKPDGRRCHRHGGSHHENDLRQSEDSGKGRDHKAGMPPSRDRQASPRASGEGQRASRQAGDDDGALTGRDQDHGKPARPGTALLDEHGQQIKQSQRQCDGRDRRGRPSPAGQPQQHHSQPADHHHRGPAKERPVPGLPERTCLRVSMSSTTASRIPAAKSRVAMMSITAGVIRLTTAKASCQGSRPASRGSGGPGSPGRRRPGSPSASRPARAARAGRWPAARRASPPGGPGDARAGSSAASAGSAVPGRRGPLPGVLRAHAVPPASRALSRCAATAAVARRRSVSAASSAAPSSVSR